MSPFDAPVYAEMRAQMRLDRRGISSIRHAAAVKREADKRARDRAAVRARAALLRGHQ